MLSSNSAEPRARPSPHQRNAAKPALCYMLNIYRVHCGESPHSELQAQSSRGELFLQRVLERMKKGGPNARPHIHID